jgi:uncharacterized membrane protein
VPEPGGIMDLTLLEIIVSLGLVFWLFCFVMAILLFLMPLYVIGIYNQTRQTARHLKEIAELVRSISNTEGKSDLQMDRENDPKSIFYKKK